MRYIIIICVVCCISSQHIIAQSGFLNTDKPQQGENISISYRFTAESKLTAADPVFAGIQCWNEEGRYSKTTMLLSGTDGHTVSAIYKIPADAAYLRIRFYHLHKDDAGAAISHMIYNKDKPARGASYQELSGSSLHENFKAEINRYPDNYFAYARYINSLPADTASIILPELIGRLSKVKRKDVGLLSALCVARAKKGELKEAYSILTQLMEQFPSSQATEFALTFYLYEQYKAGGSMMATGILYDILKKIFIQYPESPIACDHNNIITLSKDSTLPTEAFEKVLLHLYKTNRVDYSSMGILPNFYLRKNIKLDQAEILLQQAIKTLSSGEVFHQYRLSPTYLYTYTAEYLRILANVYLQQNRPEEAIVTLSAALQQARGSSFEGNLRPSLETALAGAYRLAGNEPMALETYKKMYLAGNEKVKDSIELLYLRISGKEAFNKFTASAATSSQSGSNLTPAAIFSGTDISGNPVKLSDYKGKIVVINAWFIGCAPCIVEMPDLNRLAERYADHKDVVFLGLTPDNTEALLKFVQKTTFKYEIINNLKGIEPYDFSIYPQHLIIDKNGNIAYRSSGSDPEITEKLSKVIENQLK